MQHLSHYKEKILWTTFTILFTISALLLLTDINSFTTKTIQTEPIAENCKKTIPTSTPCTGTTEDQCNNLHVKQYILNQKGQTICCCTPITA